MRKLETTDDINTITDYFSYEHFYVIYCKFYEIDKDHNLIINKIDMSQHANGGLFCHITLAAFIFISHPYSLNGKKYCWRNYFQKQIDRTYILRLQMVWGSMSFPYQYLETFGPLFISFLVAFVLRCSLHTAVICSTAMWVIEKATVFSAKFLRLRAISREISNGKRVIF